MKSTFEFNDNVEEAIKNAATIIADEYFKQSGNAEMAETHGEDGDDTWYDMQEAIREALLKAAENLLMRWRAE